MFFYAHNIPKNISSVKGGCFTLHFRVTSDVSQTIDLVNHSHLVPGPWDSFVFSADCDRTFGSFKKRFRFHSTTFLSRHFGRCVACEQSIFSTILNLSSSHLARSFDSTPQRVPVRRSLNFQTISTTRLFVLSVRSYACGRLEITPYGSYC